MSAPRQRIRPLSQPGVYTDGDILLTRNALPHDRVYGERLYEQDGVEYREWVPSRSKLSAYIMNGGTFFPFTPSSKVLYLGAASGTTSSHVAELVPHGQVYCLEFSQRSFRDLVAVCERRTNMIPILGDATRPDEYSFAVEGPDVLYQDVAQKNQAGIFLKNLKAFGIKNGLLVVKARSEDVTKRPETIFGEVSEHIGKGGYHVLEIMDLGPYEKDHAMVAVQAP